MIGDRNSYVFGSILDGVFEGKIITERDAYYVEHAKHYFPTNFTQPQQPQQQMQSWELHSTDTNLNSSSPTTTTTSSLDAITSKTNTSSSKSTTTTSTTENPTTSTSNTSKPKSIIDHHDDSVKNIGFHSVIYKDSHVDDVYKDVREGK